MKGAALNLDKCLYKVLIVDDSVFNLGVLRQMLQYDDESIDDPPYYEIIVANSGAEALEKVEKDKPDLILLDIIMPGMSGFDVLKALKRTNDERTRSIPVIVISGLESVEDEEQGFRLGAVDYITKPFHKSLVKARIKTHLRIVEQISIIEQLSLEDALTGIPNRRRFDSAMETEWKSAIREKTPISLLMIDIDNFKRFNDDYGHQQGDMTLKTVAGIIKSSVKRPNDLAARWGGEEFTALLPKTDIDGALIVAENIRSKIENAEIPSVNGAEPLKVTVSIGVSSITPAVKDSIFDFIRQADSALYNAKETGRNKVRS